MQISRFLKGSTSIPELENMTVQRVHCIYKLFIDYTIERNKAMEDANKEDRVNNNGQAGSMGFGGDELEEMMEDMM